MVWLPSIRPSIAGAAERTESAASRPPKLADRHCHTDSPESTRPSTKIPNPMRMPFSMLSRCWNAWKRGVLGKKPSAWA